MKYSKLDYNTLNTSLQMKNPVQKQKSFRNSTAFQYILGHIIKEEYIKTNNYEKN